MKNNLLGLVVVSIAIFSTGLCFYSGIKHFSDKDRIVTVKGLSTRDVAADEAVWPLNFTVSGNDLGSLYIEQEKVSKAVHDFLLEKGFREEDVRKGNVSINDNWSDYYSRRPEYRYSIRATVVVNTKDVDRVRQSNGCQNELLKRGIILNSSEWSLHYQFNGLNELKPEMVEEATKNARAVAQKFADDAGCRLGSIRNANQGQFSVETDEYQPWIKHVRVVTTVSYQLD